MSPNSRRDAFTRALNAFHRSCGAPSYAEIQRIARDNGKSISKGTIANLLSGKNLPSAPILQVFVHANLEYDEPGIGPAKLDTELRRWRDMRTDASRPLESETRPSPPNPTAGSTHAGGSESTNVYTRPGRNELMTPRRKESRNLLDDALTDQDAQGRIWAQARFGCYAFYDFDGEPIYVAGTNMQLRTRVRRHLTAQRTDAVAMNILDPQEVAELELWPLWVLEGTSIHDPEARALLAATEYTVYRNAVAQSALGALLNEHIPPPASEVELPPSRRFQLVDDQVRAEAGNLDVRISRNAEMLRRLSTTILERGQLSDGARRSLLIRSARLTQLTASQMSFVSGKPAPRKDFIDLHTIVDETA
ncbi:GIY-YIG nuclease family protein [Nocardia terpenica]|uniref:GIY-YIG nuclease family protein n=1 Tax=Nocardia terpenica TaxID=455432 RepID=UPI001893BEC1|nr:GIY-YIG nuclease family protein [Nocardia terpenica]MBF6066274.1 GIY-YIG nuclease family protein [Nocardia terpenica]MBF6108596.1 GIY-YIG nuclease family protein [Nocardia terpenica]MBF6116142.1 GIY-YIG nuclease family protein [Nocardia terpenica]MBF6123737.1 GIY-YIG nuclease family protein [Nocardia terpenica]MBF6157116.1 GIY-YIG nuclease family protein [Nocardia terpenica]